LRRRGIAIILFPDRLHTGIRILASAAITPASPNWRDQSGCLYHDLRVKLRNAGLRPTRQRVGLGWLLFARGDRHLTAETLYEEAAKARVPVSLATVYNTLHQFTEAGLLREVAVEGSKTYFDTNTNQHHHFFIEGENQLLDIEGQEIAVSALPEIPEGMEIARVEVVVRLRRKEV
jgi:Fur family iron response transcriptional regulator